MSYEATALYIGYCLTRNFSYSGGTLAERVSLLKGQYEWIYHRANNLSEWTGNTDKFNVHHVLPVGWCVRRLSLTDAEYNHPSNLILLTVPEHEIIHPDMVLARQMYAHNRQAFEIMFERRRNLIAQGKPYWVTVFDSVFEKTAKEQTERMMFVKPWPERRRVIELKSPLINASL